MASPLAAASVFARRFCAPSGAGGGLRMLPSGSRAPRLPLAWQLADPPPAATSRNPLTQPRAEQSTRRPGARSAQTLSVCLTAAPALSPLAARHAARVHIYTYT